MLQTLRERSQKRKKLLAQTVSFLIMNFYLIIGIKKFKVMFF